MGDFYARIGKVNDAPLCDSLPKSKVTDEVINVPGQSLLDFPADIWCCVVNGKCGSEPEGHMFNSTVGRCVVCNGPL